MTLKEARAKTDRAFRGNLLCRLFWMSQVNLLLDHNPNFFPSLPESEKQEIRKLKPLIAIFTQIRPMTKNDKDFRKPSTRLLWMNLVNQALAQHPGFIGLKGPVTPADMGLHKTKTNVRSRFTFPKCHSRKIPRWRQTFVV
jgi:hypothetical protein